MALSPLAWTVTIPDFWVGVLVGALAATAALAVLSVYVGRRGA